MFRKVSYIECNSEALSVNPKHPLPIHLDCIVGKRIISMITICNKETVMGVENSSASTKIPEKGSAEWNVPLRNIVVWRNVTDTMCAN